MARISKSDEAMLEQFGLAFEEVPEADNTRRSKWDPVWEAATALCRRHPGKSLKVRTYNNASTAYKEAKDVNNVESRNVHPEEGETWVAIAAKTDEVVDEDAEKLQYKYAIYLTCNVDDE